MVLLKLIYLPGAIEVVLTALLFVVLMSLGLMEARGKHLQYSKLRETTSNKNKVSSKVGMLVCYVPALLAGLSSFYLFSEHVGDYRFTLLRGAVTLHFFKRVLEVLFVHKYSGWMDLESMIIISLSYFSMAVTIIYNQNLARQTLSEPAIDITYVGLPIFLVGIVGNFYHHCLLSGLRTEGEKQRYKIPRGGLFGLVICPHYLFEIVGFIGITCISQTMLSMSNLLGITVYLMARSCATRKWYRSKFEDFPEDVKAVFPYIF